jgi:hypothetical protein
MGIEDTGGPPASGGEDPNAELARLRTQIAETRAARMAAERSAVRRTTVEIAIETAMRDRDAGISPVLVELRQRGQMLSERLRKMWASTDWFRGAVARMNAAGFMLETDPNVSAGAALIEQLQAEELHRDRARMLLDQAGVVSLRVPTTAPLRTRARAHRDKITGLLDAIVQDLAEREARRRTPTRRRERDTGGGTRG